jgi:hypothetical protein
MSSVDITLAYGPSLPSQFAACPHDSTCGHLYFQVPPRRFIYPHTVLYEPNPIDQWIIANEASTATSTLSDVSHDQVLCTMVLDVTEVR